MSVLQTISLSADAVKMRWKEPYMTAGLNQKTAATYPKGVIAGFTVVPSAGYVVNVAVDAGLGLALANVFETTGGKYTVTVFQNTTVPVDLTAQANTTVFICLDAQYSIGSNSAAQIKVVDAAELGVNADLVILAKVDVPVAPPVTTAHINMGYRTYAGDSTSLQAYPRYNLINNPSMEQASTVGWINVGLDTLTASTDTARTGTYSLKMTKAVAGTATAISARMPVTPGKAYRASAWIRSTGGAPITSGNGAKVQVRWFDSAGVIIGSPVDIEAAFTGGGVTFVERKKEVIAPALAAVGHLGVLYDGCSGTLYLDDAEFSTQTADDRSRSAVFGGSTSIADSDHTHTGAGMSYAGGANWADGTTNPATTIEGQLDKIILDLGGGTGGAAKISSAATGDVAATTVQTAIAELASEKANLNAANVWGALNTFNAGLTVFGSTLQVQTTNLRWNNPNTGIRIGVTALNFKTNNMTFNFFGRFPTVSNTGASAGQFTAQIQVPGAVTVTAAYIRYSMTGATANGIGFLTRAPLSGTRSEVAMETGGVGTTLSFVNGGHTTSSISINGGSYAAPTAGGSVYVLGGATPPGLSAGECVIYEVVLEFDQTFILGFQV